MFELKTDETDGQVDPNKSDKKSKTPFLDNFGKDLTKMAEDGKLEPICGREKEIFQILLILARKNKNNPVIIGEPGVGKAQTLDSMILTPNGWSRMGDLLLGDSVITPDGKESKITGIFPQGKKDIYEIEFKGGAKSKACLEHLWKVYGIPKGKSRKRSWSILSTEEIINKINNSKYKLKIPLVKSEINKFNKESNFFIDPYVLGAIIGDGDISDDGNIRITNVDDELINNISSIIEKSGYYLSKVNNFNGERTPSYRIVSKDAFTRTKYNKGERYNEYSKNILELGLNKNSYEKFIPESYKNADLESKYRLIQGLIDTDGYVSKNGVINYYTTSEKLANDVTYLIRSIGGICNSSKKNKNFKYKGELKEGRDCYCLTIRYEDQKKLVGIERKKSRLSDNYQYKNNLKNEIVSVKYHSNEEAQCIMIDDPNHLYITDDFIVTHNTALVEGIAQMMIDEDKCPSTLKDKRIIYIDMGSLIAGAGKQGEYEKRIETLLDELEKNENIIMFIDEIHLMCNSSLSIDAANMFKPALARGTMRLIGATTFNEYRNSIEKDGALERRFQKVTVEQPSASETIDILNKIKSKYEDYHLVKYEEEAINACVKLSGKYITDRNYPDKAIDLMDEVGARSRVLNGGKETPEIKEVLTRLKAIKKLKNDLLKSQDFEGSSAARSKETKALEELSELRSKYTPERVTITAEDVAQIIAAKTGIPVEKFTEDESTRLLNMESELKLQVVGQDDAVSKISKCIRRNRVGLKNPNKPGGVFLFLGSTGTGKTFTVKSLAKYLFGTEDSMIRFDMSEYGEKHNVSRLIGSPPGYVGYGEGGQLTEKVRRKPYCIILLDEIEKAHPDVLNVLLQVFDDGKLTDGQGRVVNFKNTIIVMTSNIGSREAKESLDKVSVGYNTVAKQATQSDAAKSERTKAIIKKALSAKLAPEFINRIDNIIIFSSLSKDSIYKIIDNEIKQVSDKLKEMGYTIELTDAAKDYLIKVGYDEEMGARPLKRAIQTYIEDPISEEILRKTIKDVIKIDCKDGIMLVNDNPIQEKLRFIKKFKLIIEKNFSKYKN